MTRFLRLKSGIKPEQKTLQNQLGTLTRASLAQIQVKEAQFLSLQQTLLLSSDATSNLGQFYLGTILHQNQMSSGIGAQSKSSVAQRILKGTPGEPKF